MKNIYAFTPMLTVVLLLLSRAGNAIFTALEQSQEGIEITSEDQVIQVSSQLENMWVSPASCVLLLFLSFSAVFSICSKSLISNAEDAVPIPLNRSFCSHHSAVPCSLILWFTHNVFFLFIIITNLYVCLFFGIMANDRFCFPVCEPGLWDHHGLSTRGADREGNNRSA